VDIAEMAIGFEQQDAAVRVTEPVCHGRDGHARLDGQGGEIVPQVVLAEGLKVEPLAGSLKGFETVFDAQQRPANPFA